LRPSLERLGKVQLVEIGDGEIVVRRSVRRIPLEQLDVVVDGLVVVACDRQVVRAERAVALPLRHAVHERQRFFPELIGLVVAAELERARGPAGIGAPELRVAVDRALEVRDRLLVLAVVL
jgi:hypothetical protein